MSVASFSEEFSHPVGAPSSDDFGEAVGAERGSVPSGVGVGAGDAAFPGALGVPTPEGQGASSPNEESVESTETREVGVGPWPGGEACWPEDTHYDPELLAHGDRRNVEDRYRYWRMEAIVEDIASRALPFEVAVENLGHDFNIGSIVRTANAMGASRVHIVGRKRWNRRGAMVTDRYLDVVHHEAVGAFVEDLRARGVRLVGIDNVEGSLPLEDVGLPRSVCLVFGEESSGLSENMRAHCERIIHITQRGSTRSMNVGHAAAVAMWAWVVQHENGTFRPSDSR